MMNWKTIYTTASLSTLLLLSACGINDKDDNNVNNTAMQSQTGNELRRVNYPDYNPNYKTGNLTNTGTRNVNYNNNRDYNTINDNVNPNVQNITNRNYNNNRDYNTINDNVNPNVQNITNRNNNNNNRISVADKAADKIAALREVDRANVLVTNNNAYVAAKLADNAGNQLATKTEKKISDLVKSTDRDIDHVYVSVNPDFYSRTTTYANDIRNGHPVKGFFNEFSTLIRRTFPTQR